MDGDERALRALVDLADLLARLNEEPEVLRAGVQLVAEALEPGGAALWMGAASSELQATLEGAEDDAPAGADALDELRVGPDDLVVGISASGTTP